MYDDTSVTLTQVQQRVELVHFYIYSSMLFIGNVLLITLLISVLFSHIYIFLYILNKSIEF